MKSKSEMTPQSKSTASNQSKTSDFSFDSIDDQIGSLPALSRNEAIDLAKELHQSLQPHIKDRMYRFKSYKSCFKHSHALSWAIKNIDRDERIAVGRLNELIDWGLVCHVVDPAKKFRVKESRTLYFRISEDAIKEEQQLCDQKGISQDRHANGNLQPIRNGSRKDDSLKAMQSKIDGIDHVLEETVKELNAANGRLELMHQKVCTLVSQQLSLFGVVFVLFVYNLHELFPWYAAYDIWFSSKGFLAAFLMIMLGRCSLAFTSSWSLLDYTRIVPADVVDEECASIASSTPSTISSEMCTKKPSFTKIVSERFGAVVSKKSTRTLAAARERSLVLSRETYSLPDVETWPHRPLLISVNTPVFINIETPHNGLGPCPLGKPFKFSSDLFEGTCLIRIKGSNSDDIQGDSNYFSGRKRIFQSVVQGRFKEGGLRVSDVLTGHEFARPLKNLPHPWILRTASNFIGRVAPGSRVVVHTEQPYVEAILAGTSQALRGDEPGNEPNILNKDIEEDCSVFGGVFAKEGGLSTSYRKRVFSNPGKAKKYKFDTETTYTFEFYQNLFDANSYSLDLGFTKIGCSKVLDGQPIQWLGKLRDGRYLWSFQIWHEKLLSVSED